MRLLCLVAILLSGLPVLALSEETRVFEFACAPRRIIHLPTDKVITHVYQRIFYEIQGQTMEVHLAVYTDEECSHQRVDKKNVIQSYKAELSCSDLSAGNCYFQYFNSSNELDPWKTEVLVENEELLVKKPSSDNRTDEGICSDEWTGGFVLSSSIPRDEWCWRGREVAPSVLVDFIASQKSQATN